MRTVHATACSGITTTAEVMIMKDWLQVDPSQLMVIGVFLLVGGLVVLFMIDFVWGVFCLGGAFYCFWQGTGVDENDAAPDENSIEDD